MTDYSKQTHSSKEHPTSKGLKPYSMIRKTYLPEGTYELECIKWEVRAASQGIREKLVFWFKANSTQHENITTGRYFNLYRTGDLVPYFPPRSDYTTEIGRLWPGDDDVAPGDLVGEKVLCRVVEQTRDRSKRVLKNRVKPTQVEEILGWPK